MTTGIANIASVDGNFRELSIDPANYNYRDVAMLYWGFIWDLGSAKTAHRLIAPTLQRR